MLFPYHLFGVSLPDKITNKKKGGRLSFSAVFNKIKNLQLDGYKNWAIKKLNLANIFTQILNRKITSAKDQN